jgi:acyl-ACP thioesterase
MDKFETSGKQVEQYMSEQAHELMLKQELRKLREEDMKKQSERAKRLEFIQKVKVIQSEKESQSRIKIFRERDQALIQLRYESAIRSQLETEEVQRTLAKWAHSGFNTSRTKLHT